MTTKLCRAITPPNTDACLKPATHQIHWNEGDPSTVCRACALQLQQLAQEHGTRLKFAVIALTGALLLVALVGCGQAFEAAPLFDSAADAADGAPDAVAADSGGEDGGRDVGGGSESSASPDAGAEASPLEDADASPGAGADASDCLFDLSGVGSGDFRVAFTLVTIWSGPGVLALVSQQTGCTQDSDFWAVTLSATGGVVGQTCAGSPSSYVFVEAGNSLSDGQPHRVWVERRSGQLSYWYDGALGSTPSPDAFALAALPALRIGVDDCSDTPAAGQAMISNLCITSP